MTTPITNHLGDITTERDAASSIVCQLLLGNEIVDFTTTGLGGNLIEYGPSASGAPKHAAVFLPLKDLPDAGIKFTNYPSGSLDSWTPQNSGNPLSPGDAWGSDGNTTHHLAHSVGYTRSGDDTSPDDIFRLGVSRAKFGIGTGDTVTIILPYRKVNAADASLELRSFGQVDAATFDSTLPSTGAPQNLTYESGDGSEFGFFVHNITTFYNDSGSNDILGIRVSDPSGGTDFADGASIEFPGALMFVSKEGIDSTRILDDATGLITIIGFLAGASGSDLADSISPEVIRVFMDILAQIRGDGSTPSAKPIDTVGIMTGLDADPAGYKQGLSDLESLVNAAADAGSYTHPKYEVTTFYAHGSGLNLAPTTARMDAQADDAFAWSCPRGHGLRNLNLFYGGGNPSDVSGDNPFGDAYGSYTMSAVVEKFPGDQATMQQIMADLYLFTDPTNISDSPCPVTWTRQRTRRLLQYLQASS